MELHCLMVYQMVPKIIRTERKPEVNQKRVFVHLCLLIHCGDLVWTYILTLCYIPDISVCFSHNKYWQLRVQLRRHQYLMLRELSISRSTSPFHGQARGVWHKTYQSHQDVP